MTGDGRVELTFEGPVGWLRLARPRALNALDRALTAELEDAIDRVSATQDVTVLVVAAQGRAFCAGNDLREMATLSQAEAEALARRQAAVMDRFGQLPQVTIAAIDGHALGGGLMLALAQDLRIASDRARFGLPEVTFGFNPAYGIARLLDVVGGGHARDLLLTGRTIRATDALRMGLVNRVVAPPTLEASAAAWATEIAGIPRDGRAATKAMVATLRARVTPSEPESFAALLATPATRNRLRTFRDRKSD